MSTFSNVRSVVVNVVSTVRKCNRSVFQTKDFGFSVRNVYFTFSLKKRDIISRKAAACLCLQKCPPNHRVITKVVYNLSMATVVSYVASCFGVSAADGNFVLNRYSYWSDVLPFLCLINWEDGSTDFPCY